MNSNNNKFFLSTSQPFEQAVDDKPYEVLDTTSKSTASSPLHVGFENTRMDENMKDYAGTNYDTQDVGFDNKSTKPSQFNNIYINNSIALNFTSNNIMSRNEAPTMVRKMNSEPLYSNAPKSQTEQFETTMCLNCGEKNDLFQDTYSSTCHSCVIARSKDQHTDSIQAQHEQPKRKDLWSNYVNLAESQKNENLRINQSNFNSVAPPQNYNAFHPQSSQVMHPQAQTNRTHQSPLPQPSANFSHERGIGKYSENIRREDYLAKQNNFGMQLQGNQGKMFESSANNRIPPPPAPKNPPPKLYEGPNYCDDEDKLNFKDELFTPVKQDSVAQEKGLKKEMLDKLDEMNFEEDFSFQGRDNDHNDGDDFDNMDGWQEMDLAGDESQHEKPTIPSIEERRNLAIAKKKVEVIDLSEHDSDKRSSGPESPKPGDLHKLFSKKHGEEAKDDADEKPVGEIISFFLENSSKKTMLFQSEPVEETHLFSVPGIEESSSRTGTDENADSRGKEVNYLNLIRAKQMGQSVSKIMRTENKKIHKIEKCEKLEKVQHKEENQTSMKIDIGVSQTCLKGGLLPLLLNKVEDDSNHLTAERTEQIVQNLLAHNQSKTDLKEVKKPFVIQNKPKVKATGALKKLGTNLQKKEKALLRQDKKERLEKEKEKDLEREKEREINWEREHEREREKLKELERKMERKEKAKEKEKGKYKHKQKEKPSHKEKEHKKVEHKMVEERESHREKETKKVETKMVEEKDKEKEKEKEKEKPKEKENKKIEAKMVEEKEKERDLFSDCISDNSEYFMFGDEYDMILECYSQESEFVDVHEVKRRMDDFEFIMRDREDIENIEEILYPKKITIVVGDQYQTKIPDLKTESLLGKGICKVWDPDRIQRQEVERFMETLSNITKLPLPNIKEERAVEILIDNNYNVDQALKFANEYLDFVKARIIYPQPKKTKEGVDKERERF